MLKKTIASFEELKLNNLSKVVGGKIIVETTDKSKQYPVGDHIEWTTDAGKCDEDIQDGFGGGTCPLVLPDVISPVAVGTAG